MTTDNVAMLYAAAIKFEAKVSRFCVLLIPLLYVVKSLLSLSKIKMFLDWLNVGCLMPRDKYISCVYRTTSLNICICYEKSVQEWGRKWHWTSMESFVGTKKCRSGYNTTSFLEST